MKRIILATLLLVLAYASAVVSQDKTAPPSHAAYPYNEATQVTLEGKIQEVKEYKCPVTGTVGAHITVKAESGPIEVHLAPVTFLKEFEITFHQGDDVKIVGSKFEFEGKPALLAKTVATGHETFAFRDAKGKPLW